MSLGNLTKQQRIDAIASSLAHRLDANETAFFARELESIDATLYEVQYPELVGLRLLSLAQCDPGASEYTYQAMEQIGEAAHVANYATDAPRVDVRGAETTARLRTFAASYGYSLQDVRAARLAHRPLDQLRARAARDAIARKVNNLILLGDTTLSIEGLLKHSAITGVSPATGTWSTATGDQMVGDVAKIERTIITDSNGIERPDTLLLPPSLYSRFATTPRASGTDTTAMAFFLATSPSVRNVVMVPELETAGASSVARIVMCSVDPVRLQAIVPLEFASTAPEARGLEFVVHCEARCGGVALRLPKSVRYMDGC